MKLILTSLLLITLPTFAATNEVTLFDGKSLDGWKVNNFAGAGAVKVLDGGVLEVGQGEQLTGLVFTNPVPARVDYEITLEGRRVSGSDFFCGLTFPIHTNSCTLILGGWGGTLTGMSSVDGQDASENQTTSTFEFEQGKWYKIKLTVTAERITAYVGDKRLFDFGIEDHRLGMRWGDIEECAPLGLATWQTKGELRNIKMRRLDASKPQH
jgi:hypothetical protein